MKLYLEVTQDKLSLPVKVCDTVIELANKTGLTANNISSQISKSHSRNTRYPRFVAVEVVDD